MKIEIVYVKELDRSVTFYIGKTQDEHFDIIDNSSPNDIWFHADNVSSCHVICKMAEDIKNKKDLRYIVKIGALLCKINTNKLKNIKNVDIIYTFVKNLTKTNIQGCVLTQNTKKICC